MEQKTHAPKSLRQRKFFTVLPLLVLPFITLLFWALGGGSTTNAGAQPGTESSFNMALPDANLKEDKPLDKLSYYEKAASDSAKLKELMKNDPNYQHQIAFDTSILAANDGLRVGLTYRSSDGSRFNSSSYNGSASTDANEAKVYQKLEQLNAVLNNTPTMRETKSEDSYPSANNTSVNKADIDRLEGMMQVMSGKGSEDPEMQQLDGMLEKIMAIQHPDRVREKIKETSEMRKGQVFAVAATNGNNSTSLLDNKGNKNKTDVNPNLPSGSNGFYALDDATSLNEGQNSIQAVIHETQTLVNGATVKLRLVNDIYINEILIPKDHFVFGTADLNGERLGIKINSIRYRNSLFPVELSAYDMDGINGIYIPGAITRDVAKGSADRAIQGININTLDPSLGAQAAGAGIEAAKMLFSKKAKLVKVTVKAGYHVLLQDEKNRENK